jgi:membrane protease YdiL (CAAX protease family)
VSELGASLDPSKSTLIIQAELAEPPTFRDTPWSLRALVLGLAGLLALRSLVFFDWNWLANFPFLALVVYVVFGLGAQVWFLVYPLLMRPRQRLAGEWPSFWQLLAESLLAFIVVLLITIFFYIIELLLKEFLPNVTLTPREFEQMAYSGDPLFVFGILLFSFTFVPIAEEMFFRGFLQNAFRQRLGTALAIVVQSLIFGFVHSYSLAHSLAAVVMGIVLTIVYEWRRTLLTPILIHAGINFIAAAGVVALMAQAASTPLLGVIGQQQDDRCIVRSLVPGSPAERAGVQAGDIVTALNGRPISNFTALRERVIHYYRPGDEVSLSLERNGERLQISVTLVNRHQLVPPEAP